MSTATHRDASTSLPAGSPDRVVFSGIQPSGHLTLGNHLGALSRFVRLQRADDVRRIFAVVDLHAMTVEHSPARLRALTRETATLFLAAGLDPERSVVFVQSAVPAHAELSYLLECTAYVGELSRMIQYKEKGRGRPATRSSLLTYPVLMAADILLYGATEVPVGDDQRQHVELTRDLALRFNKTYGDVFVVPDLAPAELAARVTNLQDPARKMSKDAPDDDLGTIRLLDSPDVVRRKVMRAVTDAETEVRFDREAKPGVSNLLELLAACTGAPDPAVLADRFTSYGALKKEVADAVVATLEPLQRRYRELAADPATVDRMLADGAATARDLAAPVLRAAREAMGLSGTW